MLSAGRAGSATDASEALSALSDFVRFLVRLPRNEGLTLTELGVLTALARNGAMRVSDLAIDQGMTQPGMTQLLTRMERSGLLARQPDSDDRRAVRVVTTARGLRLFEQRDANRVALFSELYEHLSEKERQHLRDALPVLSRLIDIKEGIDER